MIARPFWLSRVQEAWQQAPIVWLSGVRRVGKTTLAQALPGAECFNCDLPSHRALLADPEAFFRGRSASCLVLDEVHRLPDPSLVLKIGADAFPGLKLLATGSSTLAATQKFRDSLTGRKCTVTLLPVLMDELPAFGVRDVRQRLLRGGLPPALLANSPDAEFYAEWLDSYFARDVQELFRVAKRGAFLRLVEGILRLSGGQMEATTLAGLAGLSRPTVENYLNVLELTHVIRVVRPWAGGSARELTRQPKIYGFDTGFVAWARGWGELRTEDCSLLWEHVVLDHLLTRTKGGRVCYWRTKERYEVDFVLPRGRDAVDAIECKWSAEAFDPKNVRAFRSVCPQGENWLVVPHVAEPHTREIGGVQVTTTDLAHLDEVSRSG